MKQFRKSVGVILYGLLTQLRVAKYHVKRHFNFNVSMSELGTIGEQLRYGQVAGPKVLVEAEMGASEVVMAASGRFVKTDGSGRLEIAGSGDGELVGHIEHRQETTSATEGATKTQLNLSLESVYKIPLLGAVTLTRAMFYDTCDLIVTATIQGADLTSAEDTLIVVGGDITNQKWILVKLNPVKMGATAVA